MPLSWYSTCGALLLDEEEEEDFEDDFEEVVEEDFFSLLVVFEERTLEDEAFSSELVWEELEMGAAPQPQRISVANAAVENSLMCFMDILQLPISLTHPAFACEFNMSALTLFSFSGNVFKVFP